MNELEKLTIQEQAEMLKQINKEYAELELPEIEPEYDKEGKITNEKEIKKALKVILPILVLLWSNIGQIQDKTSRDMIVYNFTYYNALKGKIKTLKIEEIKKLSKTTLNSKKWNKIINQIVKDRQKAVKIKQVIKGNARILNNKLQRQIVSMYKAGKSKPQIAKKIAETMGYSKAKAKSIAMTEVNFYKSEAQLRAIKENDLKVKKIWIHNGAREPRPHHMSANGQEVIGIDTPFIVGGMETTAPQHFGMAGEDVNCHCTMRVEVI